MKLVFASNNAHKIEEIQKLLPDEIQIVSLTDIGCFTDIPETADTIEGNALLKANYVTEHFGLPCFADDSGLEVDALDGAPGVYSARYAGQPKNDSKNIEKLLDHLQKEQNRKANFKTVICLNWNGQTHYFTGIVNGSITQKTVGSNGFGYDPVFLPEGYSKTFAELTLDEKSKISHRAIAVAQLIAFLKNQ